jgi:hypothetical protein
MTCNNQVRGKRNHERYVNIRWMLQNLFLTLWVALQSANISFLFNTFPGWWFPLTSTCTCYWYVVMIHSTDCEKWLKISQHFVNSVNRSGNFVYLIICCSVSRLYTHKFQLDFSLYSLINHYFLLKDQLPNDFCNGDEVCFHGRILNIVNYL